MKVNHTLGDTVTLLYFPILVCDALWHFATWHTQNQHLVDAFAMQILVSVSNFLKNQKLTSFDAFNNVIDAICLWKIFFFLLLTESNFLHFIIILKVERKNDRTKVPSPFSRNKFLTKLIHSLQLKTTIQDPVLQCHIPHSTWRSLAILVQKSILKMNLSLLKKSKLLLNSLIVRYA